MKRKEYGLFVVAGILILFHIVFLSLILSHWSVSVRTVPAFPFMFGAVIVLAVFAILFIAVGLAKNKLLKAYHQAKEDNDREQMFLTESKIIAFRPKSVLILCSPIPYVLLTALIYAALAGYKNGTLHGSSLAFIVFGFLILGFIAIGLPAAIISDHITKKKNIIKLKGSLQKIILSTNVEFVNNSIKTEEYRLSIIYNMEGVEHELLTHEVFSKEQIEVLKQLEHIPLIKKGYEIHVDLEQVFKTQKQSYSSNVELEKGVVAPFGFNKTKTDDKKGSLVSVDINLDNINRKSAYAKSVNIIFLTLVTIFCIIFTTSGIVALVNKVYSGIAIVIAGIFFFSVGVIKPIISTIRYNRVLKNGVKGFALNYKLTNRDSDSNQKIYRIEFNYNDEYNTERKTREVSPISPFYFTTYQVQKLPIKIFHKHAIVDYEELLKYQNQETSTTH